MTETHFKGCFEVELKFRLNSKSEFLQKLTSIPHQVMLQNNIERDWYFDCSNKSLDRENKSLCIRTIEPSGIKLWIVKGPEFDRCQATDIKDADSAISMLKTLGYQLVLQMQKTRSIYFIDEFHITVDSLEGLGDFAEFAIMTDDAFQLASYRSKLEELALRFGLTNESLQSKSYKQMITEFQQTQMSES